MESHAARGAPNPQRVAGSVVQDDLIMGTNNSSIVSKRSVERLYYSDEPPFFRYFVNKPQRRAPLINRGYWLRMKAIDNVVRLFLERPSSKRKVVVNLGCGYDPLPWQCLARYPSSCGNTVFVDIDYKDLMMRKRRTVQQTPELISMLTNVETPQDDGLLLSSDQYLQIGCDLRDLQRLNDLVAQALDIEQCLILFVAEVSIAYMDSVYSDAVIGWASMLPSAQFCLLEQLLPDGEDHPFAATMMAHFKKLNTRLRSVQKYPTVDAQSCRFRKLGWDNISIRNLWELWASSDFISPAERQVLDHVEPFDEWEEFALFGCHYFLLVAVNKGFQIDVLVPVDSISGHDKSIVSVQPASTRTAQVMFSENPKGQACARLGAILPLRGSARHETAFGNYGGMGLKTRVDSYDVISLTPHASSDRVFEAPKSSSHPSGRMCHTITIIDESTSLLVGGRTSPDKGLKDCWIYHRWVGIWEPVDDLPYSLYRHQAVYLGNGCVLVSTGRINSRQLSQHYLIWSRHWGWVQCHQRAGGAPHNTYGSIFLMGSSDSLKSSGLVVGGLSSDAVIQSDLWHWEVEAPFSENPKLRFHLGYNGSLSESELLTNNLAFGRFGASVIHHQGLIYIIGGVAKDTLLGSREEIYSFLLKDDLSAAEFRNVQLELNDTIPRPLLIGSSVVAIGPSIVIVGGSAVCFSFGTSWNRGVYSVGDQNPDDSSGNNLWSYTHTVRPTPSMPQHVPSTGLSIDSIPSQPIQVRRIKVDGSSDLQSVFQAGSPVVLEDCDLGSCLDEWTLPGLRSKIGSSREVVVHQSTHSQMDFKAKNFAYASRTFGDFLDAIERGERLYLRALSSENAKEIPTNLERDYPSIASEFHLPEYLNYVHENMHSSPLRISGPVNMWLHYDVMANVLCQIQGEKRMLLFPPTDVTKFDFEPGDSSSSYNVFAAIESNSLFGCHPHETTLKRGDVLFIPSLWLHAASPISGVSVAVNVFFRDLKSGYAAGKDVYGNRDLQAYEKGRQDITRILKSFDGLSNNTRSFYLQRLVAEFHERVRDKLP